MIGTIDQYLDDAKASLSLAIVATKELLPTLTRYEEQLAHQHMQGPVWNILAERADLIVRTVDGLILKSLLESLACMCESLAQADGAKLQLQAAMRSPDLTLTKHRDR